VDRGSFTLQGWDHLDSSPADCIVSVATGALTTLSAINDIAAGALNPIIVAYVWAPVDRGECRSFVTDGPGHAMIRTTATARRPA
jgi:hypothetical protein